MKSLLLSFLSSLFSLFELEAAFWEPNMFFLIPEGPRFEWEKINKIKKINKWKMKKKKKKWKINKKEQHKIKLQKFKEKNNQIVHKDITHVLI